MPNEEPEHPRVYLSKAHLKGFKSIEDVTIDFRRNLNILIGKNGSGKSNLLELVYHYMIFNRNRTKILFDYAKGTFTSNDNHYFELELERLVRSANLQDNDVEDRVGINETFFIDSQIKFSYASDIDKRTRFEFNNREVLYSTNKNLLFHRLGYQTVYPLYIKFNLPDNLDFFKISGSLKIEEIMGLVEYPETMDFLTNIIWDIASNFRDEEGSLKNINIENIIQKFAVQEEILENVKLYSPIEDVRFNKNINLYNQEKSILIDNIRLEFKINDAWLPWSQLSDGTKRLFYIIAETTYSNGLILIEEPELGIHPHQFNLLMEFLKEQSETKQIIISTHSPKALDHLSKDELDSILIASYDLKKGTQIRHLTTTEIKKAKKYMKEVGFFSDYWMLSDLEE